MKAPAFLAAGLLLVSTAATDQTRTLDDFRGIAAWRAAPSPGVDLSLSPAEGPRGGSLRLDFDFHGRAGWAAVRRNLDLDLPANYEIAFAIRGSAPGNDLEVKLIDSSGENAWWSVQRDFEPPREWQTLRLKKRRFTFAWGPAGGGEIRHAASLEIAVTARAGGSGWIAIADLTLTALAPPVPPSSPPRLTASSFAPGFAPERAGDGDWATSWRPAEPGPAWLELDFVERREFGGLTIGWEPERSARRYRIETSDDRERWTAARAVEAGGTGRAYLFLPESEARYVRLSLDEPGGREGFGIREVVVEPLSWSESPSAFFEAVAREAPRGMYPRSFSGEQSYWTVSGADGDTESALVGEDGAVEPSRGSFSVEPFLYVGGGLLAWSDVEISQALEQQDLPIPSVVWRRGSLRLTITAFVLGPPASSTLQIRYRIGNSGHQGLSGKLFLAVRPFQVNPPTQFLNSSGGTTRIASLGWDGSAVSVNDVPRVFPLVSPSGFGAAPFEAGTITEFLARGALPPGHAARDTLGYASGALGFDFNAAPGSSDEVFLALPLHARAPEPSRRLPLSRREARGLFESRLADCIREWRSKLDRVVLRAPAAAQSLLATLRSNLAYALIERDGPAIRPGTRSYARSWIRDGALISAALLRLGHADAVRDYIAWYSGYQEPDGRVPCCVDRRGADAVPENDSHGEFLFLIAEHWRFMRDTAFLRRVFPNVERAVSAIDALRGKSRTADYSVEPKLPFFGLLPESISHEGYSARPVHSYWDDFWALKGIADAADLAGAVGRADLRSRWAAMREEFSRHLSSSIARTIASRGIQFIPGSAELADFDPTATTIALDPVGAADRLPRGEILATFERYYEEFVRRRDGKSWDACTPYELRTVGAFVRLGWRDRALELLDFFLEGRRPAAWNQWAEVVGREPRSPRFVGDMPHAWVGADFIRSFLDLFAWERAEDGAVVLAAGIPAGWLEGGGEVAVRGLRTPHGSLDYALRRDKRGLRFTIGRLEVPRGGIALRPPLGAPPRRVTVDGRTVSFSGEELVLRRLPASVVFER